MANIVTHVAESLALWIDNYWIFFFNGLVDNYHVFIGGVFVGEAAKGPVRDFLNVTQDVFEDEILGEFELVFLVQLCPAICHELNTISAFVWAQVIDETSGQDHVT